VPVNPFADVASSDWFYDDVMFVNHNGLMTGTGATTFGPNSQLTRAMIVTILHRIEGIPTPDTGAAAFDDVVDHGAWYHDAVRWAAANGIVTGFGDGRFGPGDNVTRQDLAVILMRYAEFAGHSPPAARASVAWGDDAHIAGYAKEAVDALFRAEVINGRDPGRFDPRGLATRAEVAAMLHRFMKTLG
jgi:hypothetical protein